MNQINQLISITAAALTFAATGPVFASEHWLQGFHSLDAVEKAIEVGRNWDETVAENDGVELAVERAESFLNSITDNIEQPSEDEPDCEVEQAEQAPGSPLRIRFEKPKMKRIHSKRKCIFFKQGYCRNGNDCRFVHNP